MGEHIHRNTKPRPSVLATAQANSVMRSIEMNVIIIAACIPTIRPIFIYLGKRPGADNFRKSVRERGHSSYYYRTADVDGSKRTITGSCAACNIFNPRASRTFTGSTEAINTKSSTNDGDVIKVESRELGSRDEGIEEEWGYRRGSGVPMTNIGVDGEVDERPPGRWGEDSNV